MSQEIAKNIFDHIYHCIEKDKNTKNFDLMDYDKFGEAAELIWEFRFKK